MNENGKPEKRSCNLHNTSVDTPEYKCSYCQSNKIYNQALDKAKAYWKPRVDKLEADIKLLELYLKNTRKDVTDLKAREQKPRHKHIWIRQVSDSCHYEKCSLCSKIKDK